MNSRSFVLLLLVLLFATPTVFAACKTCNPGCQNAASGTSGWTQCESGSAYCDLHGVTCTGSGGSDDGGSCDPTTDVCSLGFLKNRPSLMLASVRTFNSEGRSWRLDDVAVRTAEVTPKLATAIR
jgi:hypothetical protein